MTKFKIELDDHDLIRLESVLDTLEGALREIGWNSSLHGAIEVDIEYMAHLVDNLNGKKCRECGELNYTIEQSTTKDI